MSLHGTESRRTLRQPAPALRIHGSIRDAQGRPLGDARVLTCDAVNLEVRSSDDGRFEIEVAKGRCMHLLRVRRRGYAAARVWVTESSSEVSVDIELQIGCQLRGRVLAPSGDGLEAAELSHGEMRCRCGPRGEFVFPDLPAGEVELKVKARGFAPCLQVVLLTGDDAQTDCHVRLQQGHRLSGRLFDDQGQPVASALICADVKALDSASRSTFSDAEGRFLLQDLPQDTCRVEISGLCFDTLVMPVCLDGTEIELHLPAGAAELGPQARTRGQGARIRQ